MGFRIGSLSELTPPGHWLGGGKLNYNYNSEGEIGNDSLTNAFRESCQQIGLKPDTEHAKASDAFGDDMWALASIGWEHRAAAAFAKEIMDRHDKVRVSLRFGEIRCFPLVAGTDGTVSATQVMLLCAYRHKPAPTLANNKRYEIVTPEELQDWIGKRSPDSYGRTLTALFRVRCRKLGLDLPDARPPNGYCHPTLWALTTKDHAASTASSLADEILLRHGKGGVFLPTVEIQAYARQGYPDHVYLGLVYIHAPATPQAESVAKPVDPLDEVIDGVALRELVERDSERRCHDVPAWIPPAFTSAQRAAISAHWSAELRARSAEAKEQSRRDTRVTYNEVDPWE